MGSHHKEDLDYPNTIGDIFYYASIEQNERNKHNLPLNIEKAFGRTCGSLALNWGKYQDVMYSFPSLYAIGLKAYNPSEITIRQVTYRRAIVRTDLMLEDKLVWSHKFLKDLYDNHSPLVQKLNENKELMKFANRYFSIGNVMPIWPNGNEAKGAQENLCFDIPELYYGNKNKAWFDILAKQFPNAYLDTLFTDVNADYKHGLKTFLEGFSDPDCYTTYLKHVNSVIEYRTLAIEAWLSENKPKHKGLYTRFSEW